MPTNEQMLAESLGLSKANNLLLKKITRELFWNRIAGLIKMIILIAPIIIAIFYLSPIIKRINN